MLLSHSSEETRHLGIEFAKQLNPNAVVCFYGDLGAGKTTFIKGMAAQILGTSGEEINSPTFVYLNIYSNRLYHFDLYRLRDVDEFLSMGFDEMFDVGGICCIEWAEKISSLEIPNATVVKMSYLGEDKRAINIYSYEEFQNDNKISI